MSSYHAFVFKQYAFDPTSKVATFTYGYDNELVFTETFTFDFPFTTYDEAALDRTLQLLFFMAGVSYYKAYLAPTILVEAGNIDEQLAKFLGKTYQRGLGEFFYVNKLDPRTEVNFPVNSETLNMLSVSGEGQLVGLGGGKDSLVSVELLMGKEEVTTWSVGHHSQLAPLVERIGLPHLWVERTWDRQLLSLNDAGVYNGHVPISAILAAAGAVVAVLSGKRDVVVSNENSANEPTLEYQGVSINHQYSKSLEFEQDFQQILQQQFGDSLRYYSLLRPLSELRISQLFSNLAFEKYKDVFSSCNRAFTHTSNVMSWCGECPKCAFVFLALTPFVRHEELEQLWGKNLLLDPTLENLYRQLLGIEGDKPLECVGEVKESRWAMRLAQDIYPELADKYSFTIPEGYRYDDLSEHAIPGEVYDAVSTSF